MLYTIEKNCTLHYFVRTGIGPLTELVPVLSRVWRIYLNIRIFSTRIFTRIFVRIKILIWIYSDIRSCHFLDTNIFGYSFVSKSIRMSHSAVCTYKYSILNRESTKIALIDGNYLKDTLVGIFLCYQFVWLWYIGCK